MSRAVSILSLLVDIDEKAIRFKTARLVNGFQKLEKEDRKFWRDFEKKYPQYTQGVIRDPEPGEPGHDELKDYMTTSDKAKRDFLAKNAPIFVKEVDDLLKKEMDFGQKQMVLKQLDRKISPLLNSKLYDNKKVGDSIFNAWKRMGDWEDQIEQEWFNDVQKKVDGKSLSGTIDHLRTDRFFGQNNLWQAWLRDGKSDMIFPAYVEDDQVKKLGLESGKKVRFKLLLRPSSPRSLEFNTLKASDIDAAATVFLKEIK